MATPNATQQALINNLSDCKDKLAAAVASLTAASGAENIAPVAKAAIDSAIASVKPQSDAISALYAHDAEIAFLG